MKRVLGSLLAVVTLCMAMSGVAAAKESNVEGICDGGALAWGESASTSSLRAAAVKGSKFMAVVKKGPKSLQSILRHLKLDPEDVDSAEAFGTWCKEHYPHNTAIQSADYTVALNYVPTLADFKVDPQIVSQQCFGSAGCVTNVQISVNYLGIRTPDPTKTYTVTYTINGGESPIINNFTLTGTQINYHASVIDTPDATTPITITVTGVLPG